MTDSSLPEPNLHVAPSTFALYPGYATDVSVDLTNPSAAFSAAYKCKTTTPQRYVVRNRQGVIAPGCTSRIHIQLQANAVAAGIESEDQFLIEFRFLTADETIHATGAKTEVGDILTVGKRGKKRLICNLAPPPQSQGSATATPAKAGVSSPVVAAQLPTAAAAQTPTAVSGASAAPVTTPVTAPQQQPPVAASVAQPINYGERLNRDPLRAAVQPTGGAAAAASAALRPKPSTAAPSGGLNRIMIIGLLIATVVGYKLIVEGPSPDAAAIPDA